ncbi:hypothetical protein NDU88_003771 [Pleurodeles waltl]|uniref:Uncharacterized protein n=1 Tax=Pleurodeles waltl TaxID=8319 RepID=A0AAV7T6E5_PLEWA|nr:hypothetical protein NDU88_003771 [Pleurodeles waltl]
MPRCGALNDKCGKGGRISSDNVRSDNQAFYEEVAPLYTHLLRCRRSAPTASLLVRSLKRCVLSPLTRGNKRLRLVSPQRGARPQSAPVRHLWRGGRPQCRRDPARRSGNTEAGSSTRQVAILRLPVTDGVRRLARRSTPSLTASVYTAAFGQCHRSSLHVESCFKVIFCRMLCGPRAELV